MTGMYRAGSSPPLPGPLSRGVPAAALRCVWTLRANFLAHQGPLRAAALTYTTVLSLVPFLAIAFSLLKGFGVQNTLEPLLRQVAGDSGDTVARIIEYVNNTNVKSLGTIGLLALILTVISLLSEIEEAFNAVWEVRETRSLQRRFSDYLSVVVVGPVLLLVATSMTSGLQSQWLVQWLIQRTYLGDLVLLAFRLVPYILIWFVMVFLYVFIPNTRVRFTSALPGGILAGTAWQAAQWGYFHFQVGVAKYNAIYGTLAALPVFLVWVYVSWLIVLFGLEVVRMIHYRDYENRLHLPATPAAVGRDELGLALMIVICRRFRHGDPPPDALLLAEETGASPHQVKELLRGLAESGYLAATAGNEPGWLPARDPAAMPVAEILGALRRHDTLTSAASSPAVAAAAAVILRGQLGACASLDGVTLHDLAADDAAAPEPPQGNGQP